MSFKKTIITSIMLGFSLSAYHSFALADTFQDGMRAYEQGDNKTAVKFWKPLAEQGDLNAQVSLGELYLTGGKPQKDYAEALKWFEKAALQGNPTAQERLGMMYFMGQGVKQNYTEAEEWLKKSAEQGYVPGQYVLGNFYLDAKRDLKLAEKWLKKSCDNGYEQSCEDYKKRLNK